MYVCMYMYIIYNILYIYMMLQQYCASYDHMIIGCRNMALDKQKGLSWANFSL